MAGTELEIFGGVKLRQPPKGSYTSPDTGRMGGKRLVAKYDNGYGASVVQNRMSYGGDQGLYELAVLHGVHEKLCYATPVTNDVIGWMTPEKVVETLHAIAALKADPECKHSRPSDWDPFEHDEDAGKASFFDAFDSMGKSY